jgi:hypothetical protein
LLTVVSGVAAFLMPDLVIGVSLFCAAGVAGSVEGSSGEGATVLSLYNNNESFLFKTNIFNLVPANRSSCVARSAFAILSNSFSESVMRFSILLADPQQDGKEICPVFI